MSFADNPYQAPQFSIASAAAADERASFIAKTYLHLAAAVFTFLALLATLVNLPIAEQLVSTMIGGNISWMIVLALFMFVSWIANTWAVSATSPGLQYAGLGLYVVAQAVIFVPLVFIAERVDPSIVPSAAATTLGLFSVLTAVVFLTRKDFSFLRGVLIFGGFAALGLIACSLIFSFALGAIFTYAMIAFACCYILYDTSNVLHHYRVNQHVAASLALFASVALLFWYIIQLFLSSRD